MVLEGKRYLLVIMSLLASAPSLWKSPEAQMLSPAFPEESQPAAGAILHEAPKEVWIRFDERLEKEFSVIIVKDASGERISGRTKFDFQTRKILKVELPPLAPGEYHVYWNAISWDGPPTKGDYVFHVAPP
jgi:methionine-rich copper-binding protein CopC